MKTEKLIWFFYAFAYCTFFTPSIAWTAEFDTVTVDNACTLSYATPNTVPYLNSSSQLVSSGVTPTALSYIANLTSDVQAQINALAPGIVQTVSGVAPIQTTGTVNPVITCIQATSLVAGCLSASDWSAFNGKQAAGNYVTTLTGDATLSGFSGGSAAITLKSVATAGTYPKVTVNAKGLVTAGAALSPSDIPTLNQNTTGNAATATALASVPSGCSSGQFAHAIDASGNLTCLQVGYSNLGGTAPTWNQDTSGNAATATLAATATALAGSPSQCSSGNFATGVGANGAANCSLVNYSNLGGTTPTWNQNTTGNAATATALAGSPSQCASNQWSTGVAASGAANCSQPAFSNLSGTNSVPSGGTGKTSFTAGAPVFGNGSGALTSGSVSGNTTEVATVSGATTGGHFVKWDSSGNAIDGGLGATPGGSSSNVQYNHLGSFAGDSGFTYDGAGTVAASDFAGHLSGNASTATAFFTTPTLCPSGQVAQGIDVSGNATGCVPNAGGGGGSGTVTSVALSAPSWLTVSGSPITASGTLSLNGTSEGANLFLASPNGTAGAMAPRSILSNDLPSTVVETNQSNTYTAGPQSLGTQVETIELVNDPTTGTELNRLAKLDSSGGAIITSTSDTTGVIGVVVAGEGTSGRAEVSQLGQAECYFDNASVAGDYVQISSSSGGECHDAGSSLPGEGQVVGRVITTNPTVGLDTLLLFMPAVAGSGGGGSVSSVGAADGSDNPIFTWSNSPVTGSGTLTETLDNQAATYVFAGPVSGASAQPAFRLLEATDIPTLNQNTTGNAATATALASTPTQCSGGQVADGIAANGDANCTTVGSPLTFSDSLNQSGSNVTLTNDSASGVSEYYGWNASGVEGFFALPTGFTNPMSTLGDMMYEDATPAAARLSGNTSATKGFLTQTGTGSVSAAPVWQLGLSSGDIPNNAANTTGNAATATALASAPTTCSSGQVPTGVDVHGNATGCAAPAIAAQNQAGTELLSPTTVVVPNNQLTGAGIGTALIETGNQNLLANPSMEASTTTTDWTTTKNSGTSFAASTDSTNFHDGLKSVKLTATAATGCYYQDVTPSQQLSGTNMEFGIWVKTGGTDVTVQAREGGSALGTAATSQSTNLWNYVAVNYPGPSSGSVGIQVCNTTSNTETYSVDEGYVGEARNLSQVSQAQLIGQVKITGCSGAWSTTSTSLTASLGTPTGCTYTVTPGTACTAPASGNTAAILCPSLAPGNYVLKYEGTAGSVYSSGPGGTAFLQFWDGTKPAQETSSVGSAYSAATVGVSSGIKQSIQYTTPQFNANLAIQAKTSDSGSSANIYGTTANPGVISVYYYPTQSQLAINPNQLSAPQTTVITTSGCAPSSSCSGSNYLVPTGATYIEVKEVGGGGGGGGGGTAATVTDGGTGGTTTFGSSLLTANGGHGACTGSVGATASIGSGASGIAQTGSVGGGFTANNLVSEYLTGGSGGISPFGGNGFGAANSAGTSAVANSGSGGAGGGTSAATSSDYACAGGVSGGYLDATISSSSSAWATSFAYAVGAGGTAGSAGTSGFAGGAGGSGIIKVTAYFSNNMPILVNGVTSSGSGQYHLQSAIITPTSGSACTVSGTDISWLGTPTPNGTGDCSVPVIAGTFSANPECEISVIDTGAVAGGNLIQPFFDTVSTSTIRVKEHYMASGTNTVSAASNILHVMCKGPH